MDILQKLRIVFWFFVIGIWGLFMYQYMARDLNPGKTIYLEKNIFPSTRPGSGAGKVKKIPRPRPAVPREEAAASPSAGRTHFTRPLGTEDIIGVAAQGEDLPLTSEHSREERSDIISIDYDEYPQPPEGFKMKETRHFVIYEEEGVKKDTVARMEELHGNIMLDLLAFSPWTREKKVFVFFCNGPDTYQKLTGRPAWSGGTASLKQRKIYVYNSFEAYSILAHELTHIYFDSFFSPGLAPLWLSEGMAVYIQAQRGRSAPLWLKTNMSKILGGSGYKLDDLMRIETLKGADEDSVRLWYAQCYSVVKFLMKVKAGDAFYKFCENLKNGAPAHSALFRAYGMPYNRIEALEYAWRYDLKTGKISGLYK